MTAAQAKTTKKNTAAAAQEAAGAAQPSGLGLDSIGDLSSLLDAPAASQGGSGPIELDLDLIDEDPHQPRTADNPGFSPESIAEIGATIKERGVKSPISVRENQEQPGRYIINHGAFNDLVLLAGHDARLDVLFQREDGDRALADRKGWRGHDRRQLAGKAAAIQGELAFQDGRMPRDLFAVESGHRFYNRLRLAGPHVADVPHRLAKAFVPHLAVRVEHDFNGFRVVERGQQVRTHVAFQLALGPLLDGLKLFFPAHFSVTPTQQIISNIIAQANDIPKVFSLQDKQLIEPHDVGVLIENNCQSAPARCHSRHGFR